MARVVSVHGHLRVGLASGKDCLDADRAVIVAFPMQLQSRGARISTKNIRRARLLELQLRDFAHRALEPELLGFPRRSRRCSAVLRFAPFALVSWHASLSHIRLAQSLIDGIKVVDGGIALHNATVHPRPTTPYDVMPTIHGLAQGRPVPANTTLHAGRFAFPQRVRVE